MGIAIFLLSLFETLRVNFANENSLANDMRGSTRAATSPTANSLYMRVGPNLLTDMVFQYEI